MHVRVIALYPGRLSSLVGRSGVRFRKRKKRPETTLVPCKIEVTRGRSVAVPQFDVPEGTPAPMFKAQVEMTRTAVEARRLVCLVLSAEPDAAGHDPEQSILSPIFDDGRQMIFEFRRAFVLSLTDRREIELRLVAVHPVDGVVGTKTIYSFHTRYLPLTGRCMEHLAGAIDLFPAPHRFVRPVLRQIPEGEANLTFEARHRSGPAKNAERPAPGPTPLRSACRST